MRPNTILLLLALSCAFVAAKISLQDRKEQERGLVPFRLDGVDLTSLTPRDLNSLLDAEDEILMGKLDIWSGKRELAERRRPKRVYVAVFRAAFQAGRALFRGAVRGKPNIGKTRTVINYQKPGNMGDIAKTFKQLNPKGVKGLPATSKFKGYRGTVGKHTFITVRDGSKGITGKNDGPPTLDILSRKPDGTEVLRKFRYPDAKKP